MSDKIILINKKIGQTPLDCIKNLKIKDPSLTHLPVTYAGRLDPLASGLLLLLVGDECLKKDEYLALSKEYEVDILFGFSTDTYDLMGKVLSSSKDSDGAIKAREVISDFIGTIEQSYPVYSSRPVNGKPLFVWAREDRLGEVEIPSHRVTVNDISILKDFKLNGEEILSQIKENISLVSGDFRQDEIIKIWEDVLSDCKKNVFDILRLKISCGSGVYVRGIANSIGEKIGIPSLAFNIKRTKIGDFNLSNLRD